MIDKLPAMYFFPNDYIASTRSFTMAQRGIYTDLLFFSHTMNGKGLPCDINELCKLIFQMTFDLEEIEQNRSDLIYVLEKKFYIENDRYFNKRQQLEFVKGIELSNKRSQARKKSKEKFDSVLSVQIYTPFDVWLVRIRDRQLNGFQTSRFVNQILNLHQSSMQDSLQAQYIYNKYYFNWEYYLKGLGVKKQICVSTIDSLVLNKPFNKSQAT